MRTRLLSCIGAAMCTISILSAQQPTDVEILDAGPLSFVTPGTYAIIPTIRNNNIDYYIDHINANWQLDGGIVHSCAIDAFFLGGPYLYPTFKSRITLSDSIDLFTTGTYSLKIWTDSPGGFPDPDPSNDTISITIHVCDSLPAKNTLMWYGTHVDCIPCGGYGEDMIDSIAARHPDDAFLIRVHDEAGDPYVCDESTEINNIYIWPYSGHPSFVFDQFAFPCLFGMVPFELFYEQWTVVDWRKDYRFPVNAVIRDAWIDTIAMQIHAKVDAQYFADYSGSLNMNLVITEDSLYGYQAGYPGGNMYHTHMMRKMVGGVEGMSGIAPEEGHAGETYTWDITEPLNPDWNAGQIWLTAFVMHNDNDPLKREIYNSTRMRLLVFEEPVEDTTVQVSASALQPNTLHMYPNPVSIGQPIYLSIGDISSGDLQIHMEDITGKMIPIEIQNIFNNHNVVIRADVPTEGMYMIYLETASGTQTAKIIFLQ